MEVGQGVSIWIRPGERALIDEARGRLGLSRSEFMRRTTLRFARAVVAAAAREAATAATTTGAEVAP
jgi:hypothetical protein